MYSSPAASCNSTSTSSSTTQATPAAAIFLREAPSVDRRLQTSSSPLAVRGGSAIDSAVVSSSSSARILLAQPSAATATPSAYLTLGGAGISAAASVSASYLPSILDNVDNIEQTFVDISSVPVSASSSSSSPSSQQQQRQQSGFVPPIVDLPTREQTRPRDLSVNRGGGRGGGGRGAEEDADRDRADVRGDAASSRHINSNHSNSNHSNSAHSNEPRDTSFLNNRNTVDRPSEFNNNNIRANDNNNLRKSGGKTVGETTAGIDRSGVHSHTGVSGSGATHRNNNNNRSMVATNPAMSIQNHLGGSSWHVPSLGHSNSNNSSQQHHLHHQQQHHQHHLSHHAGGQQQQAHLSPHQTATSKGGGPRRHTGPRTPKNESNISAEEAERRRIRRERNKLAAAKCRKRRMDHTAQLQEETEELESVQKEIHDEIVSLQQQKEQLEFILRAHKVHCKRGIPVISLPAVYVPPLTAPGGAGGADEDGGLKDELASNLSNDSLSSTTSTNYSPALQMTGNLTTTTAAAAGANSATPANSVARPTNSINNNSAAALVALSSTTTGGGVLVSATTTPTVVAAVSASASRPTSLPFIVKQEPPFKVESQPHQQHQRGGGEDVKPEAMDVSVTQATGISISTPKVSPRVLSFFDVMGDHTGLTPITGGGAIVASSASASGTPVVPAGVTPATPAMTTTTTTPTAKMGTPMTDRSNGGTAEKPSSGQQQQQHTLMSL